MRSKARSTPGLVLGFGLLGLAAGPLAGQTAVRHGADDVLFHTAGMSAHHLCAGVFVVGRDHPRDANRVLAQDIARFRVFNWQDDFEYAIDYETRSASVWSEGVPRRTARYNGDQGCTILPDGMEQVSFDPVPVPRDIPDPDATPWPTGDVGAYHEFPPRGVDVAAIEAALDWAMAQEEHNTRALVVVYDGKIIGERYADGFDRNTPQISWSQGKSIASALVGASIEAGILRAGLDDPVPIAEWRGEGDPRGRIRLRDILQMSSGLDFQNWSIGADSSWTHGNEHFRIYFDGLDVYRHAIEQPMDRDPGEVFRYRNSDPLSANAVVRRAAESAGEEWLTYPQRILFDRIGARDFVLETDAWGNFIITGYDFGSARDWTRFGLLHLWDGVWPGPDGDDRILPEGWVDFVSSPAPGAPLQNYGGLFWLNLGGAWPKAPRDAYWTAGFMGQHTVIIPSFDMVIVRLGPSPGGTNAYMSEVVGRITGAVER